MKIWELLENEYVGRHIVNKAETFNLLITVDNGEIVVVNEDKRAIALSKSLAADEWELVPLKKSDRMSYGGKYYSINNKGFIIENTEELSVLDDINMTNCNYFIDKEDAEKQLKTESLLRKLSAIKRELETEATDPDSEEAKFFICKKNGSLKSVAANSALIIPGVVYFATTEAAEEAIARLVEDLNELI